MADNKIALQAKGISKEFPGVKALIGVELEVNHGEVHALLGENGAGKSTLIKVLTGVETRDTGVVWLNGKEIFPKSTHEAQELGISTVYQEVNLCPNLSVAENIFIGREIKKQGRIDWKTIYQRAAEVLLKFGLDIDVTKSLDSYSVAIQQMVAIARAVDIKADVLILDEPTSSLAQKEVDELFEIMRMLRDEGMGIVFVTHFLDQVYEICDRITVLRNGEYVGTYETENLPRVELVGKMIGKDYDSLGMNDRNTEVSASGEKFLELEGATTAGIADINLNINKGEVTGFAGLLGSGRSETARLIFGADSLTTGKIKINDVEVDLNSTLKAIRAGVAFCPENRKTEGIVGDLSIRENIILALQTKEGLFHKISRKRAEEIADEYIEKLQIKTPSQEQSIKNLSGGNQQKVILARWLATNPDLLMLDEPTRGIDVGTKAEIQRIVVDLAKEGMAMVFISSEIDEMLRCCNKMIIMRDKVQVGELYGSEITEKNIMQFIAGGEEA